MKINTNDLEYIARGAALLGTGGGGDPYIGHMLAKIAIEEYGPPELIKAEELEDDALVLTIAMVGAPTVLFEKAACGEDLDLAIKKLSEYLGKKVDALMPIEIGGINSMVPITVATRLGLPLVDVDGMGRAFPEIQMVTFNVYGVKCTPVCITDEHLNSLIIETANAKRAEKLVRVSSIEMGCSVAMSSYSMSGRELKDYGVHGTLSLALEIGKAIESGRKDGAPLLSMMDYLKTTPYYNKCKVIFSGKVTDVNREVRDGFTQGYCIVSALGEQQDEVKITFQNEFLIAHKGNTVLAIVPDLICMIDSETAEPIPVESLKYGQRVNVLGISAAPIMRTPESLAVFGPQVFGLKDKFVPIEEL